MNISQLPYNPSIEREELLRRLSIYRKAPYSRFRWWRWFDKNNPLSFKSELKDKILNGDFDNMVYYYQALYCEHLLNQMWIQSKCDILKYNEKSATTIQRRQKLFEDYWKNEYKSLKEIPQRLSKHFKIPLDIVEKEMKKFDGTTYDLYIHIEKNIKPQLMEQTSVFKLINKLTDGL